MWLKSDIAEYSHNLGFPGLTDSIACCCFCFESPASPEVFYGTAGLSPNSTGFAPKTQATYDEACCKCERKMRLPPAARSTVIRNLDFDKRKKGGSSGRALLVDVPSLNLVKGTRVEPSTALPNVADLEAASEDTEITFWDPSQETAARRRNPILSPATGMTIHCVGIDIMHTIALGVIRFILHALMWRIVAVNAFKVTGAAATIRELTFGRLKELLFTWFSDEARAGRRHNQPQQFSSAFFDSPDSYSCRLHAAESIGVAKFLVWFLSTEHGRSLGQEAPVYIRALQTTVTMFELVRLHPRRLPPAAQQEFIDCISDHMRCVQRLRISHRPKHHFMIELGGKFKLYKRMFRPWPGCGCL